MHLANSILSLFSGTVTNIEQPVDDQLFIDRRIDSKSIEIDSPGLDTFYDARSSAEDLRRTVSYDEKDLHKALVKEALKIEIRRSQRPRISQPSTEKGLNNNIERTKVSFKGEEESKLKLTNPRRSQGQLVLV